MTSSLLDVRHGSRTPRVCSFPSARTSAGHEAIELARSAGLFLDPWQQDVLIASLGEGPDGLWVAPDVGLVVPRQNGKGTILEARELAGLFLFGESILHTSHEFKTSMDHFRRLERLVRNTPDLHRKVEAYPRAPGTEGIVLRDGRALRFMARTKGSGRGFPADVVIVDEAFAATDEQLAALMPTMQSKPNPQTWYTSSPPLDGITGAPLFAMRARGEAEGDNLAWFDWGAEMGVNPDDRERWWATNPAMGYRLSEKGMGLMRAKLSPDDFSRECLGVWPKTMAETWAVISEAAWNDALDEGSRMQVSAGQANQIAIAAWISPDREHGAVAVVGPRADGDLHGEVIEHRNKTTWMHDRIVKVVQKWRPARLVIDAGGATGSLVADLTTALVQVEDKPLTPEKPLREITLLSSRDVAKGYGSFVDAVNPDAAERDEDAAPLRRLRVREKAPFPLTAAVAGATTRRIGDGTTWDSRENTVDISTLRCMTDALQGYLTLPKPEVVNPPAYPTADQLAGTSSIFRPTERLKL